MDIYALFGGFNKLSSVIQNMFYNLIYPVVKNSSNKVSDYIYVAISLCFTESFICFIVAITNKNDRNNKKKQ